jgi:hypothetical protein
MEFMDSHRGNRLRDSQPGGIKGEDVSKPVVKGIVVTQYLLFTVDRFFYHSLEVN